MANTYTLIASNTLSTSAASVTFSAIPNTFTDLVLKISSRENNAAVYGNYLVTFNGSSLTNYSRVLMYGNGSVTSSALGSNAANIALTFMDNGGTSTANTFSNTELYIPSYNVSQNKPVSAFGVQETNATAAYITAGAGLWRVTSAISSITITTTANFVSGSSFFLYGIKNS